MRALVFREKKQPLELTERGAPRPAPNDVVVSLRAAALNRRDFWITRGLYPGLRPDVVLGSDGAGVVVRVGADVDESTVGQEVVIDPSLDWGDDEAAQGEKYRILGMPDDGTFAEEVTVPVANVHPKPSHLSWEEAAALPLAALTAYRALFSRGGCRRGDKVLVTGIGGGVATFAVQLAHAVGAEVCVTSSSAEKIRRAGELGAALGFDYTSDDWAAAVVSEFGAPSLIVDGAGGEGYGSLVEVADTGARIVSYGATAGAPSGLDLFKVFWKQLNLLGSTMGSPADFRAMLERVIEHQIRPVVDDVDSLVDGNGAIERMRESRQFGKIVLRIADA